MTKWKTCWFFCFAFNWTLANILPVLWATFLPIFATAGLRPWLRASSTRLARLSPAQMLSKMVGIPAYILLRKWIGSGRPVYPIAQHCWTTCLWMISLPFLGQVRIGDRDLMTRRCCCSSVKFSAAVCHCLIPGTAYFLRDALQISVALRYARAR